YTAGLPNVADKVDAAMARAMGLSRVFEFRSIDAIDRGFPQLSGANAPGHTFVVLEVEPFSAQEQKLEQPPFDGPELKFRFGRLVERRGDCSGVGGRLLRFFALWPGAGGVVFCVLLFRHSFCGGRPPRAPPPPPPPRAPSSC